MVNVLVSEFELWSYNYVHFLANDIEKGMNSLIHLTDGFSIKYPIKIDMP